MQRLKKGAFTSQSCEETDLTGTLQFSHCGEMWPLLSGTQSVYSGVSNLYTRKFKTFSIYSINVTVCNLITLSYG